MSWRLKDLAKSIPGAKAVARRLGLATQSGWLYRRDVLEWTSDSTLVGQLPLAYRAFARYPSGYFGRSRSELLPAGHLVFRIASALHRMARGERLARLRVAEFDVVVDLRDPRFLHVVNELSSHGEVACLEALLRPGDTFVDVGANHGAFALVASRLVGASGHVVAIEPQPWLADAIEQSLTLSAPGPFEVHAIALGDRDGAVDLLIPRSYSGTAGVFKAHSGTHPHRRITVPLRRFDDAFDWRQLPGSVFVKLDTEGSEYAFLRGAQGMIRARRPTILMEVNPQSMAASGAMDNELTVLLHDLGYSTYAEVATPDQRKSIRELALSAYGGRNILLFSTQVAGTETTEAV